MCQLVWHQQRFHGDVVEERERSRLRWRARVSARVGNHTMRVSVSMTCDCVRRVLTEDMPSRQSSAWHHVQGGVRKSNTRTSLLVCMAAGLLESALSARSAARHDILVVSMVVLHAAQRMIKS
eukprot:5821451-Amphidinium_carterae.1